MKHRHWKHIYVFFAHTHLRKKHHMSLLQKSPIKGVIFCKRDLSFYGAIFIHTTRINHVCSLPGKYASQKYFTYPSVQIFKILFRGFCSQKTNKNLILRTRPCGTAFITQHSWLLHFRQAEICLVEMICTTVVPASKGHLTYFYLHIFTIHGGGRSLSLSILSLSFCSLSLYSLSLHSLSISLYSLPIYTLSLSS